MLPLLEKSPLKNLPRLRLKFKKLQCFIKTRLKSKNWNLKHYIRIKRRENILIFSLSQKKKEKKKSLPHRRRRGSWGRSRSGASSVWKRLCGSPIPPPMYLLTGLSLSLLFSISVWLPKKQWKVKPKPRKGKRKTFETESKDHTFCFTQKSCANFFHFQSLITFLFN